MLEIKGNEHSYHSFISTRSILIWFGLVSFICLGSEDLSFYCEDLFLRLSLYYISLFANYLQSELLVWVFRGVTTKLVYLSVASLWWIDRQKVQVPPEEREELEMVFANELEWLEMLSLSPDCVQGTSWCVGEHGHRDITLCSVSGLSPWDPPLHVHVYISPAGDHPIAHRRQPPGSSWHCHA